jgi:hypothetical protein
MDGEREVGRKGGRKEILKNEYKPKSVQYQQGPGKLSYDNSQANCYLLPFSHLLCDSYTY